MTERRGEFTTYVRAAALTNYFEVAQQLGFDPNPLMRRLGLRRAMLVDSDQRIDASRVVDLLEESARLSGSQTFGLRMAESRQLADFGVVSVLLKHQRSLRDALKALIEYRHLINEVVAVQIEDAGNIAILRQEILVAHDGSMRQANELALGVLSRLCSSLLGAHWRPYSVNFAHDAPSDLTVHRRVFRGRLEFVSEFNGIVFPSADFDLPSPLADPALARYAQELVDALPGAHQGSIALDARRTIHLMLPAGGATIERVAAQLNMNVRTFQRRLEDSGEVFSDLVNAARRELALRYMQTPDYSMSEIAQLLGYATPGSFTRWFTAQFGVTPTQWQKKARAL